MLKWDNKQFIYFCGALFCTVVLLAGIYLLTKSQREDVKIFSLDKIPADNNNPRQYAKLKLALIKMKPAPDHGLFGIHCVHEMGGNRIFRERGETFFNYEVSHLGLYEIYIYLQYLDARGLLPKKSLLITLPDPHIWRWLFLEDQFELPSEIYADNASRLLKKPSIKNILYVVSAYARYFSTTLEDYFDWKNVLYAAGDAVFGEKVCRGGEKGLFGRLFPDVYQVKCERKGNIYIDAESGGRTQTFSYDDMDPVEEYSSWDWKEADVDTIVDILKKIQKFGEDRGRKVSFVVTPLFGVRDLQAPAEVVMDRVLTHFPTEIVFDGRVEHENKVVFQDLRHPSREYWDNFEFPGVSEK